MFLLVTNLSAFFGVSYEATGTYAFPAGSLSLPISSVTDTKKPASCLQVLTLEKACYRKAYIPATSRFALSDALGW